MKTKLTSSMLAVTLAAIGSVLAQPSGDAVPVTADNFTRAETDTYFANIVKLAGGPGGFFHRREIEPIDKQIVIRGNRDTVYSAAVFDLDAGPVTVTLPDAGKRFMSMIVIDQDQYTPAVYYGAGTHTFNRQKIGTRYLMLALRTLVDPNDPADLKKVHALQDAVKLDQKRPGSFEVPNWDPVSHKKVRDALLVLASTLPDSDRGFGTREQVDPVRRLILSASAWGGNPDSEAKYLNVTPSRNEARLSTDSPSRATSRSTASGRLPSTTPRAVFRETSTTRIRSTTSRHSEARTVRSPSSSAAATARLPTASRPCLAGTTWCASIARVPKFWTENGNFRSRSR